MLTDLRVGALKLSTGLSSIAAARPFEGGLHLLRALRPSLQPLDNDAYPLARSFELQIERHLSARPVMHWPRQTDKLNVLGRRVQLFRHLLHGTEIVPHDPAHAPWSHRGPTSRGNYPQGPRRGFGAACTPWSGSNQ